MNVILEETIKELSVEHSEGCGDEEGSEGEELAWDLPADGYGVFRRYVGKLPERDPLERASMRTALAAPGLGEMVEEESGKRTGETGISWMTRLLDISSDDGDSDWE